MDSYRVPEGRVVTLIDWLTAHRGVEPLTIKPGSLSIDDDDPDDPTYPWDIRWIDARDDTEVQLQAPRDVMDALLFDGAFGRSRRPPW